MYKKEFDAKTQRCHLLLSQMNTVWHPKNFPAPLALLTYSAYWDVLISGSAHVWMTSSASVPINLWNHAVGHVDNSLADILRIIVSLDFDQEACLYLHRGYANLLQHEHWETVILARRWLNATTRLAAPLVTGVVTIHPGRELSRLHRTGWNGSTRKMSGSTNLLCNLQRSCSSRLRSSHIMCWRAATVSLFPREPFSRVCLGPDVFMCHLQQQNHLIYSQVERVIILPVQTCQSNTLKR